MLRSPFPGMAPYLEAPGLWPDIHNRLATIFAEQLAPLLAPKYTADLHTQIVIDRALLESSAHLVEIDLLRQWPRMPLEGLLPTCDYLAVVSDASERPVCEVWPLGLPYPLPVLPIPLLFPDAPAPLDVNQALHTAYARARYDLRVDYTQPPSPPLSPEQAAWAAALMDTEDR